MILGVLCLLACGTHAANLQIEGMLSFDFKQRAHEKNIQMKPKAWKVQKDSQVTAGPVMECIYQYPEKKQVDALLSNMMNVLTKVFVRAHDFLTDVNGRRAEGGEGEGGRHQESRFRVVEHKNTQFFEHIYHNMTHEYSKFFNDSLERVDRSRRDPCQHQEELKKTWRELLDHSLATCRRAALRCVEEHLRVIHADDRLRARLGQFLVRELAKVRSAQLDLLCDNFQLCYNELL